MKVIIKLKKIKGHEAAREASVFYEELDDFIGNYDIVEEVDFQ